MLSSLKIQNLALVESLDWHLNSGLTAITGETGAGKSVIIGALKLLSGERVDKGIIRNGEASASIQGIFCLDTDMKINTVLKEAGLPECEDGQLIIRRLIGQKGSRQFINDEPSTLGTMKKLGVLLMDLHGPHDHQSLFSNECQLQMLDRYSGLVKEMGGYHALWSDYLKYRAEYEEFKNSELLSENELELYKFQLNEISQANLREDEVSELEEKYKRASNASSLIQSAAHVISLFSDEDGVLDKLNELQRACRDLREQENTLATDLKVVESSAIEFQEVEATLRNYIENLELDPESFQELEERINTIESLKRKYGGSIDEVLLHAERINKRLSQTEEREDALKDFDKGMKQRERKLKKLAESISVVRKKHSSLLAKEVTTHLKDLGFKQAMFSIELNNSEKLTPYGLETIEFTFGPNPGEPMKPLKQAASSGEMSRVMLALKSSLAEHDETPILVFDEIDANVGGEIAAAVGDKMKQLSKRRQILSITHFPQVAAIAPNHCLVEKKTEKNRTSSSLFELVGDRRTEEITRMLGADGAQAEALAESMLAKR